MSSWRDDVAGVPKASDLYYNILVKNNNTGFDRNGNPTNSINEVPVTFVETRSAPYLNRPKDYFMSVIAFQLDTQALPIFIPEMIVGSTSNETSYKISSLNADNTVYGTKIVAWEPQDITSPAPSDGKVPSLYTNFPYYYSYSYNWMLYLLNKSFALANPLSYPVFTYSNGQIILTAPKAYLTDNSGNCINTDGTPNASGYKLFFNTELYYLFSSLSGIKQKEPFGTAKLYNTNYQLLFVQNPSGNNTSGDNIQSYCEYSPLPFWNPIDSIVFTVGQLTVAPELISGNTNNTTNNTNSYYILVDYASPILSGTEYKPNISYNVNSEFRLSDLYGSDPINSIQLNVLWKDKNGLLHPFLLESGGTAFIKLMFRKKEFYIEDGYHHKK